MRPRLLRCRSETGRFTPISTVYRFEPVLRKPPECKIRCVGLPVVLGKLFTEPCDRILSRSVAWAQQSHPGEIRNLLPGIAQYHSCRVRNSPIAKEGPGRFSCRCLKIPQPPFSKEESRWCPFKKGDFQSHSLRWWRGVIVCMIFFTCNLNVLLMDSDS